MDRSARVISAHELAAQRVFSAAGEAFFTCRESKAVEAALELLENAQRALNAAPESAALTAAHAALLQAQQ